MAPRATTPTTAAAIVAAYVAGAPVKAICARFFISRFVMTQAVQAAGVPRRPRGRPRQTKETTMTEELRRLVAASALLAVVEAGRACADSLEAEMRIRFAGTLEYPSMQRAYELNMEPVTRLRAALAALETPV